jgi:hypothetical protein
MVAILEGYEPAGTCTHAEGVSCPLLLYVPIGHAASLRLVFASNALASQVCSAHMKATITATARVSCRNRMLFLTLRRKRAVAIKDKACPSRSKIELASSLIRLKAPRSTLKWGLNDARSGTRLGYFQKRLLCVYASIIPCGRCGGRSGKRSRSRRCQLECAVQVKKQLAFAGRSTFLQQ